ncbi:MAG: hypothetical protein NTY74_07695 [Ignavibacteriae bacterium]|nr:hypothetical protein [Ignavibacteriota bacterium]
MKTLNLLLLVLSFIVLTSTGSYSQNDTSRAAAKEKLKKIVKEKLMEKMNLDDATATKFIELSTANRKEMKELRKKEKDLTDYIFDNPQSSDVGTKIEDLLEAQNKINQLRNDHYAKLKVFLTPTQIAQSMVFQKELVKFMKKEMKLEKKEKDKKQDDGNRELF